MTPTREQVISLRESYQAQHGVRITHAQTELAALIFKKVRAWQRYEEGVRKMDPACWRLLELELELSVKKL